MSEQPAGFRERASAVMTRIQTQICEAMERIEDERGSPAKFVRDPWTRDGGGGGLTRVILDGTVFEKGGVNVSTVHGQLSEAFATRLAGTGRSFFATGVSLVLHPGNPHVPTVHANFRYIEHGERRWFGGGADLTPYYYDAADREHFHAVWRDLCGEYEDVANYSEFTNWCDRYFYLPHRGERRGVGGIFFDDLAVTDDARAERVLEFIRDGGREFIAAYEPIVRRHMDDPYGDKQRRWQLLRRGRYVEFNLIYDRGTAFGLQTGGRTESILMSLPPHVDWGYSEEPDPNTPEAALLEVVRQPPPEGPVGGV